jgi:hypothetical protein
MGQSRLTIVAFPRPVLASCQQAACIEAAMALTITPLTAHTGVEGEFLHGTRPRRELHEPDGEDDRAVLDDIEK